MKAIRMIALIALIAIPSSAFAWSGRAVVVRSGFSRGVGVIARPGFPRGIIVRPGFPRIFIVPRFFGGFPPGFVVNSFWFPQPFFSPVPFPYFPSQSSAAMAFDISPPPPPAAPPEDAYTRGYTEGYSLGYEQGQSERDKERYEEGKKRGYEEGYNAGKGGQNP